MNYSQAILTEMHFDTTTPAKLPHEKIKVSDNSTLHDAERLITKKDTDSLGDYYQRIMNMIKNYDRVLLYGSQMAKIELFDLIVADSSFKNIEIELRDVAKMTKSELDAFYD